VTESHQLRKKSSLRSQTLSTPSKLSRVWKPVNLITKDGVRFDPKNMEVQSLQTMQKQQNGADLVQYVAAVNWMRSAIPNYSKRVVPLQATLAKVFEGKSRRTK
jgi:hypothetical protein